MSHSEVFFKDYFALLEISPFASMEVIQASYRALARIYHPDLKLLLPESSKTMADINEAYEVLSDPIKRENYWEVFLQETMKKGETRGAQYYFFKNWEESLKKREEELSKKNLQYKEEILESSYLDDFKRKFLSSSGVEIKALIQQLKNQPIEIQTEFLETITLSTYLTLEMEKELLLWILVDKKNNFFPFISKGFKYKDLYVLLFDYISYFQIQDYWDKILLIAQHLNIHTEFNLELAHHIIQLHWPEEKQQQLLEIIKIEWLNISFWEQKNKSANYKKSYKKLKEEVHQLK